MIRSDGPHPDAAIRVSSAPNGFAVTADAPSPSRTIVTSIAALRHEVLIRLMELRPDLLWLHAGAAQAEGSAVLACGPWGSGKSSLTAALCAMGWGYLSDDIVGIDLSRKLAVPFPITPLVRLPDGNSPPSLGSLGLEKRQVALRPDQVSRTPAPIASLAFVSHAHGAEVSLSRCSPGRAALKLLQSCMNFADHGERAVEFVCSLVKTVPAYDLSFGDPYCAAEALAALHTAPPPLNSEHSPAFTSADARSRC